MFDGDINRANDFVGDCGCSNGGDGVNVFQTTDGGGDRLEGRGGDDIYHLNYGTGHDRIEEQWRDSDYNGDANDVIKLAPGISSSKVKLSRTRDDLIVALLMATVWCRILCVWLSFTRSKRQRWKRLFFRTARSGIQMIYNRCHFLRDGKRESGYL